MPPLDRMRKIRRDIMRSINDYRTSMGSNMAFGDILSNKAATEYAEYLLENDEDPSFLTNLLEKHLIVGKATVLVGYAYLEDEDSEDKMLYNEFMDAHGLLCELEEEMTKFVDNSVTHVGVGFAWNKTQVKVVELLSTKVLTI
jgi:hypothetical protein